RGRTLPGRSRTPESSSLSDYERTGLEPRTAGAVPRSDRGAARGPCAERGALFPLHSKEGEESGAPLPEPQDRQSTLGPDAFIGIPNSEALTNPAGRGTRSTQANRSPRLR